MNSELELLESCVQTSGTIKPILYIHILSSVTAYLSLPNQLYIYKYQWEHIVFSTVEYLIKDNSNAVSYNVHMLQGDRYQELC